MANVEAESMRLISIEEARNMKSSAVLFCANDVLYGRLRPYLNKVVRPAFEGLCSGEFIVFLPIIGVEQTFLQYFLNSAAFVAFASQLNEGDRPRVDYNQIGVCDFPLPPLAEQKRIVAKIEELFSDLDAGVEALQKAKAQLKRYRQSVLKAAFDGRLTAAWREAHKNELEPASVLLERVRDERRKQAKANGKKYVEPPPVDTDELPALPEGWEWVRTGIIADSIKNGIYKPKNFYAEDGIACLRMYNIENGKIVWKNIKRMTLSPREIEEYSLTEGDILVNRVNSRELVGKTAPITSGLEECVYESKNIRLRLLNDVSHFIYVAAWFNLFGRQYFDRNTQQTVGMASINQVQLAAMPVPIAPISEQHRIAVEIDHHFSLAGKAEEVIEQSLKQAQRLRQSILKRAFEGNLVPQDPNDEPAEKLLERIKAEKEKLQQKAPKGKAPAKSRRCDS